MKVFIAIFFVVIAFTGCGGGDNMVKLNTDVATSMQKELANNGVSGDVDAVCRPVKETATCDIFVTFSDGKRQRIGDANNVRRTDAGIVWDHES
jgi:hypothetical protein